MAVPTPSSLPSRSTRSPSADASTARSAKRWRVGTVLVVGLMVMPVVLDRDSFPLSTYPMYSRARPAQVTIPSAIGFDEAGDEHRLTLRVIGASDDPLIVAGELRTAIAQGRAAARCEAIAARASDGLAEDLALVRIEVVMERHDVVAQVTGEPSLLDRTVHADCPLGASS
jgi:hypothetical protein